jgi:hypothetical protein
VVSLSRPWRGAVVWASADQVDHVDQTEQYSDPLLLQDSRRQQRHSVST